MLLQIIVHLDWQLLLHLIQINDATLYGKLQKDKRMQCKKNISRQEFILYRIDLLLIYLFHANNPYKLIISTSTDFSCIVKLNGIEDKTNIFIAFVISSSLYG